VEIVGVIRGVADAGPTTENQGVDHWNLKANLTLRQPMHSLTRKTLRRSWKRSWLLVS